MNRHGVMTGAVEVFMDLRPIKALEDEISRMDKLAALGQMAATMAHKIRNPLGGIAGFAGLLDLELQNSDRGSRLVGKITEGVNKLNRIVSNLVAYTSTLRLKPVPCDLGKEIAEEMRQGELEWGCDREGVRFAFSQQDGSVTVEADRFRFSEAVRTIIRNAVEAIDQSGGVTGYVFPGDSRHSPDDGVNSALLDVMRRSSKLLASRMPSGIVIIADTGEGMTPETKRNLFVPFYTTKENGTGLGLATAKKIVEAHHGEIWVESVEGVGTSVGIVLPRTSTVAG
jgi:signal transduction histidine kinase